jgi:hypothetical protein
MVTASVPVAVAPNAPRCPSWKIHTTSARAYDGKTTLPVYVGDRDAGPELHHMAERLSVRRSTPTTLTPWVPSKFAAGQECWAFDHDAVPMRNVPLASPA